MLLSLLLLGPVMEEEEAEEGRGEGEVPLGRGRGHGRSFSLKRIVAGCLSDNSQHCVWSGGLVLACNWST